MHKVSLRSIPAINTLKGLARILLTPYLFRMGTQNPLPTVKNVDGFPAAGLNENYSGLCAFACNYGYCPAGVCSTVKEPLTVATVSPFLPDACTAGTGAMPWTGKTDL